MTQNDNNLVSSSLAVQQAAIELGKTIMAKEVYDWALKHATGINSDALSDLTGLIRPLIKERTP